MAEPVTPTRKPAKTAEELAIETAFDFDDTDDEDQESNEVDGQVGPVLDDIVAQSAPLDYNALGLPPSSPPSSIASSSPSTSPRFTVEDELMADGEDGDEAPAIPPLLEGIPFMMKHREPVEPSSPRTEETQPLLTSETDIQCLVDILGMVNVPLVPLKEQPTAPDTEFWSSLLLNQNGAQPNTSLHGSDIFDFTAAQVDGLINTSSAAIVADGCEYESLLESL